MPHFRYEVPGGEFVIEGDRDYVITFNGVRLGGLHPCADDAVKAIERVRKGQVPGPNLRGIVDPPSDLTSWHTTPAWDLSV